MTKKTHSRRIVLGSIAGTLTALAGCANGVQNGQTSSPFDDVGVNGRSVVVSLVSDSGVERVNLIDPDGKRVASSEVVRGETHIELELGTDYTPGTFGITAEPQGEVSLEIRPNLKIREVGIGENHLDRMPDSLKNTKGEESLVVLENEGNGPTDVLYLAFEGDVPNPSEGVQQNQSESGIFDAETGGGERERVTLKGHQKTTIYSSTLPFSFAAGGTGCESMPSDGVTELQLGTSTDEQQIVAKYKIEYSSTESNDGCQMMIKERTE
jgi:hypothetical protein